MSHGAAPPRRPARQATSNARRSAPLVRIRHSRSSASSFSVTPGRIDGRSEASARSAMALAAATRSSSEGSLSCRPASTQPSIGTSSTPGAASRRRSQVRCGMVDASIATRRTPAVATSSDHGPRARCSNRRSSIRGIALDRDRVPRIGEDPDVLEPDQEFARVARARDLALVEGQPGEVAHVLPAHAEVAVDALLGHPLPKSRQALRACHPVCLGPARPIGRRGRRREVGRMRPGFGQERAQAAVADHGSITGSRTCGGSPRARASVLREGVLLGFRDEPRSTGSRRPCRERARHRSMQAGRGDRSRDEAGDAGRSGSRRGPRGH